MAGSRFLDGKVVLVTGAGGGIGRDFALAVARAGADGCAGQPHRGARAR